MNQLNRKNLMLLVLSGLFIGCAPFAVRSQPAPVGRPSKTLQQEETVIQREHIIVHGPVTVRDAPPPTRTEVITVAPLTRHIWVPGYWIWRDDDWVWQSGYWELRPYPDAAWVPGQWVATTDGWLWKDGYWR